MHRRNLLKGAAAAAVAMSVGACTTSENGASAGGEGIRTLSFWHLMTGVNGGAVEELVRSFNESVGAENNVRVELVFQGEDTMEKLKTLAQANDVSNFPDITMVPGPGVPVAMGMNGFVPIQSLLDGGKSNSLELSDLEPNMIRACSYQNQLMTMPFSNSTLLLYYNKGAFAEVGLDPDVPPATMAELADAVGALSMREGGDLKRAGLNIEVRRYQMSTFIGGQGQYNFFGNNEGGRSGPMTEVTFGQDGSMAAYLTEWQKVVDTGGYKPIEDNVNEEFATGLSAMTMMSTSRLRTIKSLVGDGFDWAVAPVPKVNVADTGGAAVGGSTLGIFDRGVEGNVDAAWLFLQYAASPEAQTQWHIATGYIPVNVKAYETADMQQQLASDPRFKVAIDQLHASSPNVQEPFDVINWDVDAVIRETMRQFGAGELTVSGATDEMVTRINEALAAYDRANR